MNNNFSKNSNGNSNKKSSKKPYNKRFEDKNENRSSKKNKFQNKVTKHTKSDLLVNYSKCLHDSNDLMNLARKLHKNQYIRLNLTHVLNEGELVEKLQKHLRVKLSKTYLPLCYKVEKSHFSIAGTMYSLSGSIYIQDISSQLPLNLFDFSQFRDKNMIIVDMCSSPGSKTSQLKYFLEKYNINAIVYANELRNDRIRRLINNVQKSKLSNVEFINLDAMKLKGIKADLVLLDAPCSGNLILEKNWLNKRTKVGILKNSRLQKQLLDVACNLCTKNGYIIYSTCSMEIEENEENVVYASKNLGLKSVSFIDKLNWKFPFTYQSSKIVKNLKDKDLLRDSVRTHPPYAQSQGFFVNIFRK